MYNNNRYNITNYKSKIFIANKLEPIIDSNNNQIPKYDKPIKYIFNVQPVRDSSEVREFGEISNSLRVATINKNLYNNKFHDYDLAYLYDATPENEENNGDNANYRIYSVRPQNAIIKIYFIQLVK